VDQHSVILIAWAVKTVARTLTIRFEKKITLDLVEAEELEIKLGCLKCQNELLTQVKK
jgi:cytochrome c-type biogenesis protein CcmH/NrfF